jgi:hypothetical protein
MYVIGRGMDTSSRNPTGNHGTILAPPIAEFERVRVMFDVEAEGYSRLKDTKGTVVGIYGKGAAYAVEIANLPGGPDVVTLRADQVKRAH